MEELDKQSAGIMKNLRQLIIDNGS